MTRRIGELDFSSTSNNEERPKTDNNQIEDISDEVALNRNLDANVKMDSNEHWQTDENHDSMHVTEASGGSSSSDDTAFNHDNEGDPIKSYESKPNENNLKGYETKPKKYESEPKKYAPKPKEYEPKPKQYDPKPKQYEPKPKQYEHKPKEYDSKPKEYDSKPKHYETRPKEYESKPEEYKPKPKQYESKPKQYDSKPKQYNTKPKQYEKKPIQYNKSHFKNQYKPTPYSEGSKSKYARATTKSYRSGWDYKLSDDQNNGGSLLQELFGREPRYLRKH